MPSKEKPYKYVVRLPPQMRNQLAESAQHYRRSINSDIVARLHQSFSGIPTRASEQTIAPPLHDELEHMFRQDYNNEERALIRSFRRLSKDKRLALQSLLH